MQDRRSLLFKRKGASVGKAVKRRRGRTKRRRKEVAGRIVNNMATS